MARQWMLAAVLLVCAAALSVAVTPQGAPPAQEKASVVAKATPIIGTVASVKGLRVEVTIQGEKPDWVRKGSGVKVKGGLGKIVDVTATTVSFNTKKASAIQVGEKLTVEKGAVVPAGC